MTSATLSTMVLRDVYARMLQTRIVDDYSCKLYQQGYADFIPSCYGYEAAQVGSAFCIKVGQDFTLPYYQDLGVVLTIGMTPSEVFHTYLQAKMPPADSHQPLVRETALRHWGYHKHNTITGPAPVATQLLHAAGIAFASKLRKAHVATVAYCNSDAINEPDFHEGIRFAALQHLPVVFICEHAYSTTTQTLRPDQKLPSCLDADALPEGLSYNLLDGSDVIAIYTAMQQALQRAREEYSPTLLEIAIPQLSSDILQPFNAEHQLSALSTAHKACHIDPLLRCQYYLEQQEGWNEEWYKQLHIRLSLEVERALQDALHDISSSTSK